MINTFRVLKMGEGALQNNTGSRAESPLASIRKFTSKQP